MKTILSIILFLSFTTSSVVKKRVLPYGIVISKADLIVEGKISDVSHFVYEYEFEVTDFVKGKSENKITVDMWKEWTCDKRIKRPKVDQRLILFLTKNQNNEYEIINGSTGELFITENDSIKTFTYYDNFPKLDELKKGIKLFQESFEFYGEMYGYGKDRFFKRLKSESEIKKLEKENEFFKSTVDGIQYYEIK
ncbi:hypothetical protein [Hanstruepera flava]|uniref:hypothetical protein n=1 Tax=Hanstruepera flava TaxID=2930218 RepID=UPI0020296F5F|nr:hypothetical protein [Hanstruepera flava]